MNTFKIRVIMYEFQSVAYFTNVKHAVILQTVNLKMTL